MFRRRGLVGVALLGFATLACLVTRPATGADDPASQDKEVVDSKAMPRPAAASIPFRKELNLSYPTLGTLGSRIDAARRAHDPVALANMAHELSVAEDVSGKKASLTSATLMTEAAQLAALKRQEKELEAVLRVTNQVAIAEDNVKLLRDSLNAAKRSIKEDSDVIRRNEEPTWTPRKVVVNNYTDQYLDIWVNGNYKVQVAPGMSQLFYIEHRWNPTVLTAYGNEDSGTFGPRYIWGRFNKYTWNIN
jgi:hypothetical protein